jgi:WhiB family transcriptional regulator, redox-sensing transcriptional regulator
MEQRGGPARLVYEEPSEREEVGRPRGHHAMATDSWEYGWQWLAACRGADTGLFFAPNELEDRGAKKVREAQAKAICAGCSVRSDCLEYAIRIREQHGVWGGLNELERRLLIRERERTRDIHSV